MSHMVDRSVETKGDWGSVWAGLALLFFIAVLMSLSDLKKQQQQQQASKTQVTATNTTVRK